MNDGIAVGPARIHVLDHKLDLLPALLGFDANGGVFLQELANRYGAEMAKQNIVVGALRPHQI